MQELGLVVVIIILGLALTFFSRQPGSEGPNPFLNFDNLVNRVATPMSVYAIMAVGVTCVIISGGIDISVGSIFAISALGAAAVLQRYQPDTPAWKVLTIGLIVGPGIGLLCGVFNGVLVTALRLHPFIVTLGTMSIIRGIGNVATTEKTLPTGDNMLPDALTTDLFQRFYFPGFNGVGVRLMPMVVMLVWVMLGAFFIRRLVAGRETYAIGGNEEAARFSGLRVNGIKIRVYALSGLSAGLAGLVALGRFGTVSTNSGSGYELTVIAAAVVGGASLTGGRGTAMGALLGALVIRMIENGIDVLKLNQQYGQIIVGSAIIVAAAIDRFSEHAAKRRAR
ncbi:MAG: ABC transporter permease [Anaerolineae bacterium]|nr:ABC transporter permease [Phycisphaerae bacterium]